MFRILGLALALAPSLAAAQVPHLHLLLSGTTDGGTPVADVSTWLRFLPDALPGWDMHDLSKAIPGGTPLGLIASVGERDGNRHLLQVDSRPDALFASGGTATLTLSLLATDAGSYTLAWTGGTSIPADGTLTLTDLDTGATTDMIASDRYAFDADGGTWADRFEVSLKMPLSTAGEESPGAARLLTVAPNPARDQAHVTVLEVSDVRVVDALGRIVMERERVVGAMSVDLAPGVYTVIAKSEGRLNSQRVTVVR